LLKASFRIENQNLMGGGKRLLGALQETLNLRSNQPFVV